MDATDLRSPVAESRWLIVLLLLLAAALSAVLLDDNAFDADESHTFLLTGGPDRSPVSLAEVVAGVLEQTPDQGQGWFPLVATWAHITNWSEVAFRSLSWFGGLLAIALVWRAGRNMIGPSAGLVAAALLATSVMFIHYMTIARSFALVVLFTVTTVYGYWLVALRPAAPRLRDRLLMFTGAVGLLYTHYFGALLLPALGLFHVTQVRRDRRWQQAILVFLLAGLAFLPQVDVLLQGVEFTRAKSEAVLAEQAMAPHVAVSRIVEVYSNGLARLLPKVAGGLFGLAVALFLLASWRRRRMQRQADATWLLLAVTVIMFSLILVANEIMGVLLPGRVRYAIGLWPLFSLLIAAGLTRVEPYRPPQVPLYSLLLALLLVTGLVGNIRSSLPARYFHDRPVPPLHHAMRDMEPLFQAGDRLVIDPRIRSFPRTSIAYT